MMTPFWTTKLVIDDDSFLNHQISFTWYRIDCESQMVHKEGGVASIVLPPHYTRVIPNQFDLRIDKYTLELWNCWESNSIRSCRSVAKYERWIHNVNITYMSKSNYGHIEKGRHFIINHTVSQGELPVYKAWLVHPSVNKNSELPYSFSVNG